MGKGREALPSFLPSFLLLLRGGMIHEGRNLTQAQFGKSGTEWFDVRRDCGLQLLCYRRLCRHGRGLSEFPCRGKDKIGIRD